MPQTREGLALQAVARSNYLSSLESGPGEVLGIALTEFDKASFSSYKVHSLKTWLPLQPEIDKVAVSQGGIPGNT